MTLHSANPLSNAALAQAPKVLVIDDDPEIGRLVKRSIERLGGACRAANPAENILDIIRDWQPSHIILDLVMPSENGMSVTQRLAHAQINTPVIFSSGADRRIIEAVARSARLHGLTVAGLLPKPFTRAKLAASLGHSGLPVDNHAMDKPARAPAPHLDAAELESAIMRGDIRPWLQPQVASDTGEVVGFEALARWHHPIHGIIAPAAFIGMAEAENLIGRLTMAVVNQALHWLSGLPRLRSATLSVNVPPSLLESDDFIPKLLRSCERYAVEPARVVLEVTEGSSLSQDVATLDRLTQLRLEGIKLSIDDFGIGHSSLLHLAHIPFSEIKIDRTFVSAATRSEEAKAILMFIISLAEQLEMTSVAEGVEDKDTLVLLKAAGCHRIQGYYFSPPISPSDAKNLRWQYEV